MVTGTTASSGDHSSITGRRVLLVVSCASVARNSVWPASAKPDLYKTFLATGLVTTAAAAPRSTPATARRMDSIAAGALDASGRPGSAVTRVVIATTGSAEANAFPAASGPTAAIGTATPSCAARRRRHASSPTR